MSILFIKQHIHAQTYDQLLRSFQLNHYFTHFRPADPIRIHDPREMVYARIKISLQLYQLPIELGVAASFGLRGEFLQFLLGEDGLRHPEPVFSVLRFFSGQNFTESVNDFSLARDL